MHVFAFVCISLCVTESIVRDTDASASKSCFVCRLSSS